MIQKKTGYKILSRGIMQRGILAFFLNHIVSFISALRAIIGFSPVLQDKKGWQPVYYTSFPMDMMR
jgi:hypothetical protein